MHTSPTAEVSATSSEQQPAGDSATVDAPAPPSSSSHPRTRESSSASARLNGKLATSSHPPLSESLSECSPATQSGAQPPPPPYVPAASPPRTLPHEWASFSPQDATHSISCLQPPPYFSSTTASGTSAFGSAALPAMPWMASGFPAHAHASCPAAMLPGMPLFGAPAFAMPPPPLPLPLPYAAHYPPLSALPYGSAAAAAAVPSAVYGGGWAASPPEYAMPPAPPMATPTSTPLFHSPPTWSGTAVAATAVSGTGVLPSPVAPARQPAVLSEGAKFSANRAQEVLWRRACVRVTCVCEPPAASSDKAEGDTRTLPTPARVSENPSEASTQRIAAANSVLTAAGASTHPEQTSESVHGENLECTPVALTEPDAPAAEALIWRWLESLGMADAVADLVCPDGVRVLVVWEAAREHRGAVGGAAAFAASALPESVWGSSLAGARLAQRLASGDCGILDVPREVVFDGVRLLLD